MATLNSLDGVITSAGNNPPINQEFTCTLYSMEFPATGGSIEYVNHTGSTRKYNFSNLALADRINKIISISGVKLTDLGLVFNIPAASPMPTWKTLQTNKAYNVKSFKVYFGTPVKPMGTIIYYDETGVMKQLSMIGTTTTIKATKFSNLTNVRVVDLNPEIADFPVATPPFSIMVGSYKTILTPVDILWTPLMNPPVVPLVSGGNNPTLNTVFAATRYTITFPEVGTGTIEYADENGKVKKYSFNKSQVMSPDGTLLDNITKVITLNNVTLTDRGLVYKITEPVPAPNYIVPTALPIKPAKPKYYHVYFGNPVNPQGSIIYFDSKGANKAISTAGTVVTIDASSIYSMSNVKLVEVGDVV